MSVIQQLFTFSGRKFYKLFNEVGENLLQMSSVFVQAHCDGAHMRNGYLKQLLELEHANDVVTDKLYTELGKNFVTPFDREDIHYLATALDDIADHMYSFTKQQRSYGIVADEHAIHSIADQHRLFIKILATSLTALRNKKELEDFSSSCREMRKILYANGNAIDSLISALFNKEVEVLELIKRLDVYETLRKLIDKCSDAVNAIESIVVKYS